MTRSPLFALVEAAILEVMPEGSALETVAISAGGRLVSVSVTVPGPWSIRDYDDTEEETCQTLTIQTGAMTQLASPQALAAAVLTRFMRYTDAQVASSMGYGDEVPCKRLGQAAVDLSPERVAPVRGHDA